jgi:ribose 5-phosphate isomerase A
LTNRDAQKRAAAERAVEHVASGMRLGLGTGSTARHVVDVVAAKLRDGTLRDIVAVPTSRATETHARSLGIPLTTLDDVAELDLAIDGADEIDPRLDLIKGLGGALLWEKIVEFAAARLIIVADDSKLVQTLGEKSPLPVEVIPFGARALLPFFRSLGAEPRLREGDDGAPFVTDSGHHIVDLRFDGGMRNAAQVEAELRARPGVVETGLFLGMADVAVIAGDGGIDVRTRSRV